MRRSCERADDHCPRAGVPDALFPGDVTRTRRRTPAVVARAVSRSGPPIEERPASGGRRHRPPARPHRARSRTRRPQAAPQRGAAAAAALSENAVLVGDPEPGTHPAPVTGEALDSIEGRNWAAEVHVGPIQLAAALSTHLQLLRRQLGAVEEERVDHMLEIATAATDELRRLMARLEPPVEGEPLLTGLSGSVRRVLGADVEVIDGTGGNLAAPARCAVLGLAHRALVEMRRSGARAPGRIEVTRRDAEVEVRIVLSAGGQVTRHEPTLGHRARLAGGSAGVAVESGQVVATIGLPGM
jgi:hypothetical protein